jgi:hypothetical protein
MKFASPHMEFEFAEGLDDQLRLVVQALDFWSRENGIPEVFVTEVQRTVAEQERIYTRHADKLIYKLKAGSQMRPADRTLAVELAKLSRDEVMDWARRRFSWHLVNCAIDMRVKHYSETEADQVMEFIHKRCPAPKFEVLKHDVTAPHIHLGVRRPEKRIEIH